MEYNTYKGNDHVIAYFFQMPDDTQYEFCQGRVKLLASCITKTAK